MIDQLLPYYKDELLWLRKAGQQFAKNHPRVASRLMLDGNESPDPFTERLLEGFAFLAARVHRRLDDDFPRIVESLLDVLYPHYLRPIPSVAIAQFELDPDQGLTSSEKVKRGKSIYSRPIGEDKVQCTFRVCFDTELWPVAVEAAQWLAPQEVSEVSGGREGAVALRVRLKTFPGATFSVLKIPRLRFYLHSDGWIAHALYELLTSRCLRVVVRDAAKKSAAPPFTLAGNAVTSAGWEEKEALLPWDKRSFSGYRLLHEYFAFPEKFLFFEVNHLEHGWDPHLSPQVDLIFLFSRTDFTNGQDKFPPSVDADTFRLGCTPIVNLFSETAEPISLDGTRHEYQVVPSLTRRGTVEIFSLDEVSATNVRTAVTRTIPPLFFLRHNREQSSLRWSASRNAEGAGHGPTIMFASVDGSKAVPDEETVTVHCTWSNGEMPTRMALQSNHGASDFEVDRGAIKVIRAIKTPTSPIQRSTSSDRLWKLVSHLSLNYLSLVTEGKEALQEILELYNHSQASYFSDQIQSIASLKSSPHFSRVASSHGIVFARGLRIEMELEEERFSGGGAFLFAAVLDRFLGHYVSLNSFSQLIVRSRERRSPLYQCEPRTGNRILL